METGTTAVLVSPGQEEAMRVAETFKNMASQAADAIVNASKLRQDMDELRASFDELKRDMEYTRTRNAELDRNLADVRRQRDEAEQKLSATNAELSQVKTSLVNADAGLARNQDEIKHLHDSLDGVRKERDDYGLEAMKLRDELAAANAKLAEIEEFASRFVAKQAPKPAEVTASPPEPTPVPRRVYDRDAGSGYSWDSPHKWDDERGSYYNEV